MGERENGSGGQPAEPPPEVSAAPDWLDPAAQSHTHTHTNTSHTHTHHTFIHKMKKNKDMHTKSR